MIAGADLAKATFYKHFPAKDPLIVACFERAEAMADKAAVPMDGLTPLTDYDMAMIAIAGRPTCLGCTYQATAAEFSDIAHPAHQAGLGVNGGSWRRWWRGQWRRG